MYIFVYLKYTDMNETKGAMCASCGTWHYMLLCPKCGNIVSNQIIFKNVIQ